jgi:hypothetical protein
MVGTRPAATAGAVDEPGEGEVLPRQADRRVDGGLIGVLVGWPVAAQDFAERDGGGRREAGGAERAARCGKVAVVDNHAAGGEQVG